MKKEIIHLTKEERKVFMEQVKSSGFKSLEAFIIYACYGMAGLKSDKDFDCRTFFKKDVGMMKQAAREIRKFIN